MRLVVLPDRDEMCPRQEDVGSLEHRVAKQSKGHPVEVGCAGHILQAWDAFQTRDSHQHLENQVQFVGLRDRRLQKDRTFLRIDARGEVVQQHLADILLDRGDRFALGLGRQRMQVGDDEVTLILILELEPVGNRANIMTQVQASRGTVPGKNAFLFPWHVLPPYLLDETYIGQRLIKKARPFPGRALISRGATQLRPLARGLTFAAATNLLLPAW